MSLFLGNLSSRIQRDDIERVFRRFGRINVQLKDGYGFVIYDIPANAEKALRALRGKNICGESISLTWANKQPRQFQRGARGGRFYESHRKRDFTRREAHGMRKMGSHDPIEFKSGAKPIDNGGAGDHTVDLHDKDTAYPIEDIEDRKEEEQHNGKEVLLDEGDSLEPNAVDNDRWGEPVSNPSNGSELEKDIEFDRYEPYHGYDIKNDDKTGQRTNSYGSTRGGSQKKGGRENRAEHHPDNPKPQQACYICGRRGHIMRNCPRADAYRRKKLSRIDHRRDNDINFRGRGQGKAKRERPAYRRRQNSTEDPLLVRRQRSDRKTSGSRKARRLTRTESIPVKVETCQSQLRMGSRGKKKREKHFLEKQHHGKKPRRSDSSLLHSDSYASSSRSHSWSSKSVSGTSSHSRSKSVSSREHSVTSSSRSTSSSYSRSESFRSKSRSSSRTSLSLSMPPAQPLSPSPNKVQIEATSTSPKSYPENITSPKCDHLLEQRLLVEVGSNSEDFKLINTSAAEKDGNAILSIKPENENNEVHPEKQDGEKNLPPYTTGYELKDPCMNLSEKGASIVGDSSSKNFKETRDLQISIPLMMEHTNAPVGKSNFEVPVGYHSDKSTSISPQEMYMALKHYGFPVPEENENHFSPEDYFGSARLWPWEIIYYRRLRKGPISTENYARRIAQNRQFGIVDRYIRSSSGWGECD